MASATAVRQKALGAYYTDDSLVQFLVGWGLRQQRARVFDPSCGDGRFLLAAAKHGARTLVACDVEPSALLQTKAALVSARAGVETYCQDFFALEPSSVTPVDLIVGNPPFIRYQRFTGDSRLRALESSLRVGVKLTRLTSSWAPFLLHAIQFLQHGGDLAMVVPAEIAQTQYGLPALRAIMERFHSAHLLTFERNLFADAQADTLLLLASGFGGSAESLRLLPLRDARDLAGMSLEALSSSVPGFEFSPGSRAVAGSRVVEAFLRPVERRQWSRAKEDEHTRTLASLGGVANGYVTGDNAFFHRTVADAKREQIPTRWLRHTARQSKSLLGLAFTTADLAACESHGQPHHLVVPPVAASEWDGDALERFLAEGEARGTTERFKCRTRDPWWVVPGLLRADVLVTYMAGAQPKAAVNEADAVYTNTLHGLRLHEGNDPRLVALVLHSSLARLSLEIEGRTYGGGILKVEPTELQRVRVPWPKMTRSRIADLFHEVDAMLRAAEYERATRLVDDVVLREHLGWSGYLVRHVRAGRKRLTERRMARARGVME